MLKRRLRSVVAAAVALLAWVFGAMVLADVLVTERPLARADAIVVLSGAADFEQRAEGAALAFREGIAPVVLVTDDDQRGGWDDNVKGNPFFVERMTKALERYGVPEGSIERLPGKVHGTDEEADLVIRIAAERNYEAVVIVTSDYHSRRALWVFDRASAKSGGNPVIGLVRSPSGPNYPGRLTWWLSVRGWRSVAGEYVKFGYYWLFY